MDDSFISQLKVRVINPDIATQKTFAIDDDDFVDINNVNNEIAPIPETVSVTNSISSWNLDSKLANVLIEDNINHFSTVQCLVIPQLLKFHSKKCVVPRDLCVSAPTGSGKTLAYALPIMNALIKRKRIRLRALVILPSRELANQVFNVFCRLSKNNDIKVASVTGQKPFEEEQRILSSALNGDVREENMKRIINLKLEQSFSNKKYYSDRSGEMSASNAIDILVCTPGRLLDHLYYTKGFTLQHLQFVVLDEADRLLGNAYHDWVRQLIFSFKNNIALPNEKGVNATFAHSDYNGKDTFVQDEISDILSRFPLTHQSPQRLLFSATLTDNPKKMELLGIKNPVIIRAGVSNIINASTESGENANRTGPLSTLFILPTTLSESVKVCDAATKPLVLISILLEAFAIQEFSGYHINNIDTGSNTNPVYHSGICKRKGDMCIIFSSSVETTHRLCLLLQILNGQHLNKDKDDDLLFGGLVKEMSRSTGVEQRNDVMNLCCAGKITILISSDQMSRGIDLSHINLVINYDAPKHAKTYVHRVGRTARAGRQGHAITILKEGQVGIFKKMRCTINSTKRELTGKKRKCDDFENDTHTKKRRVEQSERSLPSCRVHKLTIELISQKYAESLKMYSAEINSGDTSDLFVEND